MIGFPDTSFLCALYRSQVNSPAAAAYFKKMPEALHVSSLLLYEFRQSVRLQVWLRARDKNKGFPRSAGDQALADLQTDLDSGAVVLASADWANIHRLAETLSKQNSMSGGHRSMDILHVATALHLGAREFVTFDTNQQALAASANLTVKP